MPRGVLIKANTALHVGRGANFRPYSAEVFSAGFAASEPPPPLSLSQLWPGAVHCAAWDGRQGISDRMLGNICRDYCRPHKLSLKFKIFYQNHPTHAQNRRESRRCK